MRFKLSDIAISISYPSIALICLCIFTMNNMYLLLFSLVASIIHEAGHIVYICKYKGKPESINIKLGEIAINCNNKSVTYFQEILIVAAGVIANLTSCFLFMLLYSLFNSEICFDFAVCNLVIGVFNLLPVKTFDGGQLLELILIQRFSLATTEKLINVLTVITVIPVTTAGFSLLLSSEHNYSILFIAIYLIFLILSKEMR